MTLQIRLSFCAFRFAFDTEADISSAEYNQSLQSNDLPVDILLHWYYVAAVFRVRYRGQAFETR
jgi:hypothetical protein